MTPRFDSPLFTLGLFTSLAFALGSRLMRPTTRSAKLLSDDKECYKRSKNKRSTTTTSCEVTTQTSATTTTTASSTQPSSASSSQESSSSSVQLVLQRFRNASLLTHGAVVSVGEPCGLVVPESTSCGLLVYISFAKAATTERALAAAKTILNLPLLTQGAWGDGGGTKSVMEMTKEKQPTNVVLVPQANLVCKVRGTKSIQYHGQIEKEVGKSLYQDFLDCTRALLLEQQCLNRKEQVPQFVKDVLLLNGGNKTTAAAVDPSVNPLDMYRDESRYSDWDDNGIPMRDATTGEELSKSAIKKLKKLQVSQAKRYEKYETKKLLTDTTNNETEESSTTVDWSLLDENFCTVVDGSFGGRQALDFCSDMGPFCHVVSL